MIRVGGWLGVLVVLANAGHLFSPIVLAWLNDGLRVRALAQWGRHIVAPLLAFSAAFVIPLWWLVGAYTAWNAYHYAMQHHGFWALTRWRAKTSDQRLTMRTVWLAVTAVAMLAAPTLMWPMSVFHWLGDIGLSAWSTQQRWAFLLLVLVLGASGLVLMNHGLQTAFPALLRARLGLGFAHFIYSALVWPAALRVAK